MKVSVIYKIKQYKLSDYIEYTVVFSHRCIYVYGVSNVRWGLFFYGPP